MSKTGGAGGIVITGVGLCTPFGAGREPFVEGLRNGRSCAGKIRHFDTSGLRSQSACCVPGEAIDGLDSKNQRQLPRAHQFAMVALEEAVSSANLDFQTLDRDRVGVCYGVPCNTQHAERLHETLIGRGPRMVSPLDFKNTTGMAGPGTVMIEYGITGPTIPLPGGFSSGLQALHVAAGLLRGGVIDVGLVVACDEIAPLYYRSLGCLRLLSPRRSGGRELSRPFDVERNGMVLGEGSAAVVLETRSQAVARRAKIQGELCATAVVHDGHRGGQAPGSANGLERAMRLALGKAAVEPRQVDYLAACGNSTRFLDRMEISALTRVFGEAGSQLAVSSIKSMTGETGGAGGLISVAACLVAMREGFVPPNIHYTQHERPIRLDIIVNSARTKRVKVAVANAYSFGGSSSCAVLCRPPSSTPEKSR